MGYVNDGFLLYSFVANNAQKYVNIQRDSRISAAIGSDAARPLDIKGLSLAGRAAGVDDQSEFDHVAALRLKRYPEFADLPPPVLREGARSQIVLQIQCTHELRLLNDWQAENGLAALPLHIFVL